MFAVRAEKGITPGRWILIEYKGELGIVAGDLKDLDWRRSTAIKKVEIVDNGNPTDFRFHAITQSGSQYVLYGWAYGLTPTTAGIVDSLSQIEGVKIVWTTEEAFDRLEKIANGTV